MAPRRHRISRVTSAAMVTPVDAAITSESYEYLGLDRIVKKTSPISYLTYIQKSGDTAANTDAGDKYTGLDRFGRVIDQVWRKTNSFDSVIQRYQYGYDRVGNRLFEADLVDSALSDLYDYDDLNQLTDFARGTLSDSNSDGILDTVASPSRTQAWDLDAMGNWQTLSTNGTGQSRTHNAQNQVTGVGSASLTFDANGSMTTDQNGNTFVYDAWNRLVEAVDGSSVTRAEYAYDALGRRIVETRPVASTTDHLYYSTGWQVLEERRGGTASGDVRRQYLWSIDYVDAMAARVDYASGSVTAKYDVTYDANWNVTAIMVNSNAGASIQERYTYDPYGAVTILAPNGTVRSSSSYDWKYLHQTGRLDGDTGLYHFRNRDYSPTLGRWTRNDPIGFEAGDTNLYRYVGNGPVNGVDPSGLDTSFVLFFPHYFLPPLHPLKVTELGELVLDGDVPERVNPGWGCTKLKQAVPEIENSITGRINDINFNNRRGTNTPARRRSHWHRVNQERQYLEKLKKAMDWECKQEDLLFGRRPKPPVSGMPGESIKVTQPKENEQVIDSDPITRRVAPPSRPPKPTPDAQWVVDTITGKGYWRY